ncbi:hypothetical protein P7K49_029142 [Saguinus oedipus]|uniref:PH domain-containing protein n=1 Tax=Saguinus oedipus TaxID=9490 RepID=A0ABQ9U6D6_SAGOE|nr:hypothetical protein P7K49_029142 [Saguinus oedipus]
MAPECPFSSLAPSNSHKASPSFTRWDDLFLNHPVIRPSALPTRRNRMGQDSYVLMASSQAEMEEWVKFLRRVAGIPSGGNVGLKGTNDLSYGPSR